MSSKNKTEKQKDIDDALSSIDSLLDTATDVEADDLPALKIKDQSEPETIESKEKIEKLVAPQQSRASNKKPNKKVADNRKTAIKNQPAAKAQPVVTGTEKPKENQSAEKTIGTEKKPITKTKKKLKPQTESKAPHNDEKNTKTPAKPEAQLNLASGQAEFSITQKELPVLDEVITEEEMILIATGKNLPKQVITEKFAPKTTADKIIDAIAIQLADYNVTRLEYEYIHELIAEILTEDKD